MKLLKFLFSHIDFVFLQAIIFFKLALFAKYLDLFFLNEPTIMVSLGTTLVLSSWTLLQPNRGKFLTLYIIDIILTFIIFADLIYFRYFGDFITVPVLMQAKQVGGISSSIIDLIEYKDLLFFIDIIVLIPIFFFLKKIKGLNALKFGWKFALFTTALVIGLILVIVPLNTYISKNGKNLFINTWSNISIYSQTGQIGFHVFDAQKYLSENVFNKKQLTAEEKNAMNGWFDDKSKQLAEDTPYFGMAKGNNVLMIQLEAFQNYVIGTKVNGEEITPNLNALVKESMYFSNFYHQVGQGRTSDAEFLANNSLYPLPTGSVYVRYPSNEYHSLPKILKQEGYYTGAFHSYMKNFWNRNLMYQNYQFDEFIGDEDFEAGEIIGPLDSLGDKDVFEQALAHVKDKQPFYSFIVSLTSHHPFTKIAEPYRTLELGNYENTIFGNYIHSMHYVDYALGELVKQMKAEGLWDNTVLVLYGDHDSGVPLDNETAGLLNIELDELRAEEILHEVPLIIHVPKNQNNGTFEQTAGMLDITPSLLHLLGIDNTNKNYMGNNIFTLENQQVTFRNGSFSDGTVLYQTSKDMVFENGKCFNLTTRQLENNQLCQKGFDRARQELRISDNVIYHNLLKQTK